VELDSFTMMPIIAQVDVENWLPSLIPLGGFGVLIYLLLSYKLIHPNTLNALLAEKDKQIDKATAEAVEWKEAFRNSEAARVVERDARTVAERRADVAVEAAQLVADGLDKIRQQMERDSHAER
jgi:hypothetical protein